MGRHGRHAQPAAPQPGPASHRGRRKHHPVRTGLLASSAAMAVGAVAVSSGLLSTVTGGLSYQDGDGLGTQAGGPAPDSGSDIPSPLGGSTTPASGGTTTPAGSPSGSPSGKATPTASPRATPTRTATAAPTPTRTTAAPTTPVATRSAVRTSAPTTSASQSGDAISSARGRILALVNQQRAAAGCQALTASASLDTLAQNFSDDMAARGFFDHTDPDGRTPWDRADALGVTSLGGENIARGQADAQAVMDAWMNSPGHRANILNCDYKTLGVGIHFGTGGPWWTQDFGF
ncbi:MULTISPECIES: CAP domain-containing protein [unclassified Streptomyces]|uniref:CAP domain-containing protein n=1 Tax=unclassified Streptomyces TaxID=2593676 RepID=UPI002E2B50F6|nr:CAP domain-containing protein [Streptomyces sp. NBC_00223]